MRIELDAVTMKETPELAAAGNAAVAGGDGAFDFSMVKRVDSSALAAVIGWRRRCGAAGIEMRLEGVPPALRELAKLYGVASLLGLSGSEDEAV